MKKSKTIKSKFNIRVFTLLVILIQIQTNNICAQQPSLKHVSWKELEAVDWLIQGIDSSFLQKESSNFEKTSIYRSHDEILIKEKKGGIYFTVSIYKENNKYICDISQHIIIDVSPRGKLRGYVEIKDFFFFFYDDDLGRYFTKPEDGKNLTIEYEYSPNTIFSKSSNKYEITEFVYDPPIWRFEIDFENKRLLPSK